MEEFKTYTLAELSKGKGCYGIAASAVPFSNDKYTYLRITDIKDDGTLNRDGLMSVDDDNASKYILKKNDIVFARTGNSTGRAYFYDGSDGILVYAGFLIKFSIDETKINPLIIKYFTHSKPYYDWVKSFDTGGTRGNINAKTFGDMPITLPASRDIQNRIAAVLSSLDAKIELNRRINDNLEQQAQALFRSWFVDFEPFGGVMPKEWKVKSLSEIATYLNGLAMQKYPATSENDTLPILKIRELGQGFIDDNSDVCSRSSIGNQYFVNDGDIIFSWSGTLIVKIWIGGECGLNQHLFKVSSERYPKWFFYLWTKYHNDSFIRIAKDKAVTMGHIKRGELDKAKVFIPTKELMDKASALFNPILEQYIHVHQESYRLSSLRDTLLPKLMSGELKVNEINA